MSPHTHGSEICSVRVLEVCERNDGMGDVRSVLHTLLVYMRCSDGGITHVCAVLQTGRLLDLCHVHVRNADSSDSLFGLG